MTPTRTIVFRNQKAAVVGRNAFPECYCIYPDVRVIRGIKMQHIVVMADVDLYETVDGVSLYSHLKHRQAVYPASECSFVHLR